MSNVFVFPMCKNYNKNNWNEETKNALMDFIKTNEFIEQIKKSGKEKIFIKGCWYTCYYAEDDNNIIKISENVSRCDV